MYIYIKQQSTDSSVFWHLNIQSCIKYSYTHFFLRFLPEVSIWRPYSTEMTTCWWLQRSRFLLWRLKIRIQAHWCRTFYGLLRCMDHSLTWQSHIYAFAQMITMPLIMIPIPQQVSYLWEEISWLQQCLGPSQTSCSCTLQTRLKMLQAVSHLQVV